MTVPAPLACDAVTTHDPATGSVLVKVVAVGASFWRRGHQAMLEDAGVNGPPAVLLGWARWHSQPIERGGDRPDP
jgi:hypothetical protein